MDKPAGYGRPEPTPATRGRKDAAAMHRRGGRSPGWYRAEQWL